MFDLPQPTYSSVTSFSFWLTCFEMKITEEIGTKGRVVDGSV